jgi:methyl-accepting chemotaxis protein
MRLDLSIQRKLAFGFALGPIILAIVGWIAYANTDELLQSRQPVVHSYQVIRAALAVEAAFNAAENNQRGYQIQFTDAAMDGYRSALREMEDEFAVLARLTADNPAQQARVQSLRSFIDQRGRVVDNALRARAEKGLEGSTDVIQQSASRQLPQNVRKLLDDIEADENKLLDARSSAAEKVAKSTFDTIIWGTILSFVLLSVIGFFIVRSITKPVREAVDALAATAAELLAGTAQQASGMQQQSSAVSETVTTVDEVLRTSEQAVQRAQSVADASRRAVEEGDRGRQAVEEAVSAMNAVKDRTSTTAESILMLSEQAAAIGDIITTVNEIADQSNLLALNAAIEASRAGEHGRGFGVVASEIKLLADQSKKATAQVRQILGDIQKATNNAVMVTEDGTKSVNAALDTVEASGRAITTLTEVISDAAQVALQITASAGQQNAGMAQIHQAMNQINAAANQNLAATRQSEEAARNLNTLGARLRRLIA